MPMPVLTDVMREFLDCVINPFDHDGGACVPDGNGEKMVTLTDYNFNLKPTCVYDGSLGTCSGALIMMVPSFNALLSQKSARPDDLFQTIILCLDATGVPLLDISGKIPAIIGVNYPTIFGSSTSFVEFLALTTSIRWFSGGIRAWPVIEYVTDSSTLAVTSFFGGLMKPNDIYAAVVNNTSVLNIVYNSDDMEQFANHEGVTVRLDPFSNKDLLTVRNFSALANDAFDNGGISYPTICVQFNQSLAVNAVMPIYLSARWWFDGVLLQPTPIYSRVCPPDLSWDRICLLMRASRLEYPVAVSGHSFSSFNSNLSKFARLANTIGSVSSSLALGNYTGAVNSAINYLGTRSGNAKPKRKKAKKPVQMGVNTYVMKPKSIPPNTQPIAKASKRRRRKK